MCFVARHYCKFSVKLDVFRTFQPLSLFRYTAICCIRLWNWTNPVTWVENHSTVLTTGSAVVRTDSGCLPPLWHGFNPRPAHMVFVAKWLCDGVFFQYFGLPLSLSFRPLVHTHSFMCTDAVWLCDSLTERKWVRLPQNRKEKNYEIISEIFFTTFST